MALQKIERLTDFQVEELHRLYQNEWWTRGRKLSDIKHMLQHSDIIVAFCDSDSQKLIAFARVLTDFVYKAVILDVIVHPEHRNRGIGTLLMDTLMKNPAVRGVQHIELYCLPELVPFYQKWGFDRVPGDTRFLRYVHKAET